MKLVKFTRDMKPYVSGESRLVPDDVAARLAAEGSVAADPADFPPRPAAAVPVQPPSQALSRRERRAQAAQLFATK